MSAALLKKMRDMGLSMDQAIELMEAWEEGEAKPAPQLSKGALRTRKWREKKEAERHGDVPVTHHGDVSPTCEGAQVEDTSSSLRSEGTQEAIASFVDAPNDAGHPAEPEKPKTKPPKATRGTRLPEDWEPSETDVEVARREGLTDEEIRRAALEFRNYWCSRSRDATRLSWPRTWHNRVLEIADRKRRNGPRMAAPPGHAGGGRRGAPSFADLYALRHGPTGD